MITADFELITFGFINYLNFFFLSPVFVFPYFAHIFSEASVCFDP